MSAIWTIGKIKHYQPQNPDRSRGWRLDLRRTDGTSQEPRPISVEVVGAIIKDYPLSSLPYEVRDALSSRGQSAVGPYLSTEEPPRRLLVSTHGVAPTDD